MSLRWLLHKGCIVIPRSRNEERLRENMEVYGWELAPEDEALIDGIKRRERLIDPGFAEFSSTPASRSSRRSRLRGQRLVTTAQGVTVTVSRPGRSRVSTSSSPTCTRDASPSTVMVGSPGPRRLPQLPGPRRLPQLSCA